MPGDELAVEQPGGRSPRGLRMLVVDPRTFTRDCLVAALDRAEGIAAIASIASIEEAGNEVASGGAVDVALINLASDPFDEESLGGMVDRLHECAPGCATIILSHRHDATHVRAALRLGIDGYLGSDMPFKSTIEAIRIIAQDWVIYPRSAIAATAEPMTTARRRGDGAPVDLTPRQGEVLEGLMRGMTNKAIAITLAVSERTVKAHVKELMRRFDARNRTQIVSMVALGRDGD